jgi:hypothetical protein
MILRQGEMLIWSPPHQPAKPKIPLATTFFASKNASSAHITNVYPHNETGRKRSVSMASLQQIEFSSFAAVGWIAVAFLRRSCTILTFHPTESLVGVHRQIDKGVWNKCGIWTLPPADRIIGFYALESFYYFVILAGYLFSSSHSLIFLRAGKSCRGILS